MSSQTTSGRGREWLINTANGGRPVIQTGQELSSKRSHLLRSMRRLEIHNFEVVLAVAELGSFRKAGQRLNIGQSAISRRVRRLEDMLGVSLFERLRTGVRLTGAGWRFCDQARAIVRDVDAVFTCARCAGTGRAGRLRIGLIASLSCGAVREVTTEFVARHPDVELLMVESERSDLQIMLTHRRLDAVIASGAFAPGEGDSLMLMNERTYLALPEGHVMAARSCLTWDDVRDEHFLVCAAEPAPETHDYIIQRLRGLGTTPHVTRHRVGREAIMNLVGLGFGVSLVADHWRGASYPRVVFREVGDEDERIPFWLLWRPENDNPALRRFVSLARVHVQRAASSPSAASRTLDLSP